MNRAIALMMGGVMASVVACGGSSPGAAGKPSAGQGGAGAQGVGGASSQGGAGGVGGEGGATAGAGGSGTTPDGACANVARARCEALDRCTKGTQITERFGRIATCEDRYKLLCLAGLAAAYSDGSPERVERCAEALTSVSCADLLDNNPPMACLPQAGTLDIDAACAFDAQCASKRCKVDHGQVCGTCAALPTSGDPCETSDDCGRGLVCLEDTMTCAPVVGENGACGGAAPCGAGLSCVGETATAMGVCKRAAATVGAACDPKASAAPGCDQEGGLYCDDGTRTCAILRVAASGEPCGLVGSDEVRCSGGGTCVIPANQRQGTCKAPAADGAACDGTKGPPCLFPARCVPNAASGTAGVCKLPSGKACR